VSRWPSPTVHGAVDPRFLPVARALAAALRRGGGGAVTVLHHGHRVVDVWGGHCDAAGTPWSGDTRVLSFSTTKGMVATTLHRLVDRGLVAYDDPVATVWPEFAAGGKAAVTVRHILSHRSGLHRLEAVAPRSVDLLDWDLVVGRLAAARPVWDPGTRPAYEALTFGFLVGEVIRRVAGAATVDEVFRSEVLDRVGVGGASIGAAAGDRADVAELLGLDRARRIERFVERSGRRGPLAEARAALYAPGLVDLFFTPEVLGAEIPAANGVFTARALAHVYDAIVHPDPQAPLLSPATVAAATAVQTMEVDAAVRFRMRWRLGYHMAATGAGVRPAGFGHFGFGGSGAWTDPSIGLTVAYVTNQVDGTPFADQRILRIGQAAVASAIAAG
jgi:CubicO group peptidase (beta-lactamase class C family)